MKVTGSLKKMRVLYDSPVVYYLPFENELLLNEVIGKEIRLEWSGRIHCQKCSKVTKKSFGEGFCYSCFLNAPESSPCILRPELCRAHLGEGRDPEWEERNHNQAHVVYLALSSSVKVGITRKSQVPTRWIDQGASKALILAETPNRYEAGRLEIELKSFFTDKTNWQRMLKNEVDESSDLLDKKWELEEQMPNDIRDYFTDDETVLEINYPVLSYPEKVKSLKFDTERVIQGKLTGIKGQYLMIDEERVLNVRSHTGYEIQFEF
jgi:hypothetical protein